MNLLTPSSNLWKTFIIPVLLSVIFTLSNSQKAVSATSDTTGSVSIRLNMTKAVNQHLFSPDSDFVYLVMDHGILPLRLLPEPGYTYTGTILNELEPGVSYQYKFRINDSLPESVNRTITAQPGLVSVSAWWNNEPLNITTFVVNMQYAVQSGLFNPDADSVFIAGTMNLLPEATKMQRIDTTLSYAYVDTLLVPGSVHQYKYRINADSAGMELAFKPARIVRIPDTLLQVTSDFNNYNPAKLPMTFQCNMGYYIGAHHFDASSDFLDVAGNFNNQGANDVLFDTDGDSLYSLQIFFDTARIHQEPLSFKFRINGNWNTAELAGSPDRTYVFHDTIQQNPNFFACFYNNLDPSIPTPPRAYNLDIQGLLIYKKFLSGIYSYENVNGIPEDSTTYRWLRSSNALGTDAVPIDSATKIAYIVDTLDIGKWIVFEVTPRAASGDSATGKPVRVVSSNSISAWDVGMGDLTDIISRVFPNPASDHVTVVSRKELERIEILNYMNQTVLIKEGIKSTFCTLSTSHLPSGFYLLKATTKSGQMGVARLIRN
jgi:hypothetical protein